MMKNNPNKTWARCMGLVLVMALSACGGSSSPVAIPGTTDTTPQPQAEPVMKAPNLDQLPPQIATGSQYTVNLQVSNPSSEALTLVLNWGDGSAPESQEVPPDPPAQVAASALPSGAAANANPLNAAAPQTVTFTKTYNNSTSTAQAYEWLAQLLNPAQEILVQVSGSVTVDPLPATPSLVSVGTPATAIQTGLGYNLVFRAEDTDGDLAAMSLKWNDESAPRLATIEGSVAEASFSRTFTKAATYTWTAQVRDAGARISSPALTGKVAVTAPVQPPTPSVPTLTLSGTPLSTVFTQTAYELAFNAADKDGDLKTVALRWSDETSDRTVAISGTAVTGVKFSRTFTQAGTFTWTAKALDAGARTSTPITTGQVVVTVPPPTDDFPLPTAQTNDSVKLLGQECAGAQNGFFPMPATDDANVAKRRRYVFDQFLVAKADKTGYDPKLTFDKWLKYEVDEKKKLYEYFHSFGLVALMFHQGSNSTGQAQTDWYNYANQIARKSVGNVQYEPFQRYQMMDTFMRWRCVMEPATEAKIKDHMIKRPFGGNYGTANLKILNAYTRYMTGLAWPDATLPNMLDSDPDGSKMLAREAGDAYKYTSGEWASQPYDGYNTFVYLSLAQLSRDRKLAAISHLAFQAAMAKTASVWMKGILSTYSLRDYPPFKSGPGGAYASHWFYLGGKIPAFTLSRSYLVGAAVNYALPAEILAIATDRTQPLDTPLMLYAGTSKVHSHSYIEKDFGVFSVRSATRDGTGSTFTPGQTTPPGVVWSPKFGRANFWLTITEDDKLTEAGKGWTNSTTNEVMTKRGQQWLQHKGTLLMVTDNREGQIPEGTPILHQIVGSMPDVHSSSTALNALDTACAQTACTQSTDGQPVYQLFYARDGKVMMALSSSHPFSMFGAKRSSKDWLNESSFRIPLNFAEQLAAGVAVETADYANTAGTTVAAKLTNWKNEIIQKSKFRFVPPSSDKERATLYYTDRLGNTLHKEYIWQGNAPYWRTKGWAFNSNPDPTPHETINGVAVNHTLWPAANNRLVHQATVGLVPCPLYIKKTNGAWLKIWDNTNPPYTPNSACKAPT
jgi:hypothetical protein